MSKTQEALKMALEQAYLAGFNASADGYNGECGVGNASQCTQWLNERDNYIRKALAEQPAQQDSETITQNFTGLPKRKLRDLLSAGWQINGVCFQRTEEDGTVRRGAATTGGMVLWWNTEQTAQQQSADRGEPVGMWMGDCIEWTENPYKFRKGQPLYTSPPAQQHPDLSHLRPETQEAIRGWIKDGTFFDRAIGAMHDQEQRLMAYEKAQQQEPVAFSQFLSDVVTAAGLLSHGKADKSLAARISEFAFRLRTSPQPAQQQEPSK